MYREHGQYTIPFVNSTIKSNVRIAVDWFNKQQQMFELLIK